MSTDAADPVELVKLYLRGQNLEQMGRVDDAIEVYERAVEGRFDSPGPYDRLIALYGDQALHADVIRIVEAAVANVHTYPDKITWYARVRDEAGRASGAVPKAVPKKG